MNKTNIAVLFALICAVYFIGIGVDTMDVDASQYAGISREMKESGSYLQVYEQGKEYLDKPPFLFWISALSMKIFGENNLGYKFPSILFAIFAVIATFRFAKLFYDRTIALLSAAVLATCQAVFL
ncbi:MAG: glycosyltransferase family 39 protein, partial [Lacibacter sp.]|nr:glycosyltransferase family 39 protein [Lacibacter sp.]